MRRILDRIQIAVLLCAGMCGCGAEPTAPSGYQKPPSSPGLEVRCASAPTLRCSAFVFGEGDVTPLASWLAAESFVVAMGGSGTISDAVIFPAPGVPTAVAPSTVYIGASYDSARWGRMRNVAQHAYALTPDGGVTPLANVNGYVFNGAVAAPPPGIGVPDAIVEIVSGEGVGRRATTSPSGSFEIGLLPLGRPFRIRASKPGYTAHTRDHPGIVDNENGFPSNTAIHFTIESQ